MQTRLIFIATMLAQGGAAAQDARQAAAEACESEVMRTVQQVRGRDAQQVQIVGSQRVLAPISDDDTGITGQGRYRNRAGGTTSFSYSCTYNARSNSTSGVLFRDTTTAAAPARRGSNTEPAAAAAEPPIASTDACESAVAKALQDKHPRASRIVFGSDTRTLRPAPESRTSIDGEGAIERAPGMSAVLFNYRCVLDARSGKVERVQTSD